MHHVGERTPTLRRFCNVVERGQGVVEAMGPEGVSQPGHATRRVNGAGGNTATRGESNILRVRQEAISSVTIDVAPLEDQGPESCRGGANNSRERRPRRHELDARAYRGVVPLLLCRARPLAAVGTRRSFKGGELLKHNIFQARAR